MGGLFSVPSPPPPPPPPSVDNKAALAEQNRRDRINRKRRGRRGLIATSPGGLLGIRDVTSQQRSLFGE